MNAEIIDLVSDEDDELPIRRPPKRPRVTTRSASSTSQRTATPPPSTPPPFSDDELVLVSHTNTRREGGRRGGGGGGGRRGDAGGDGSEGGGGSGGGGGGGEGVECVGERRGIQALADYPHFRFQCALEQFKRARAFKKERFCERCFCYVCDIPAAQCAEWAQHSKAVDTVPKWRAEREARLEHRRRKEQCGTAERGTIVSRISAPVPVRRRPRRIEAFENGNSSDALDAAGESASGDDEDLAARCDFDATLRRIDQVSIEADCFEMGTLARELRPAALRHASTARRAAFNVEEILD